LYAGASKESGKLKELAASLAKGVESSGNDCDVFDMALENGKKISFYDYIIIGTEATGTFGGKIPDSVKAFLRNAGTVSGKRCMAFVKKSLFRSSKTLQVLMKTMEGEGMYLRSSDVIPNAEIAQSIGKRLIISK
jgi:menaquinone-dependent protoporphyrinogen IX oxidase